MDFYRMILLDDSLKGYLDKIFDIITAHLSILLEVSNPSSKLVFEYTMSGIFGTTRKWIKEPNTSASETARVLAQLSYAGLLKFKNINN